MREGEVYTTPSRRDASVHYEIRWAHNHFVCSCPGYSYHGHCAHADAVNKMFFIGPEGQEQRLVLTKGAAQ